MVTNNLSIDIATLIFDFNIGSRRSRQLTRQVFPRSANEPFTKTIFLALVIHFRDRLFAVGQLWREKRRPEGLASAIKNAYRSLSARKESTRISSRSAQKACKKVAACFAKASGTREISEAGISVEIAIDRPRTIATRWSVKNEFHC